MARQADAAAPKTFPETPGRGSLLTVGERLGITHQRLQALTTWGAGWGEAVVGPPGGGQLQENERVPQPPPRMTKKPKGWLSSMWAAYNRAYESTKHARSGWGNAAAGIAGLIVGPHNCILKFLFVRFVDSDHGEDDYGYHPRCAGFDIFADDEYSGAGGGIFGR